MIAITGLSYGFSFRALPLTGGGVAFAMAALGRTHAFIAGWTIYLPEVAICSLFIIVFAWLNSRAQHFLVSSSSLPL